MHLTTRGRVLMVTVVAGTLVLLAFILGRTSAASANAAPVRAPMSVAITVRPHQTLWQLAADVAPGTDRRSTIEQIMAMNGLRRAVLAPGQRLLIPMPAR